MPASNPTIDMHLPHCSWQRVHFKLNVGEDVEDYKRVQEKERLTELQVEVRKLIDKANKIKKEQDYQRVRPLFFYAHFLPHSL